METGVTDMPPPGKDAPCTEVEYVLDPEEYLECFHFLWDRRMRQRNEAAVKWLCLCAFFFGGLVFWSGVSWPREAARPFGRALLSIGFGLDGLLLVLALYRAVIQRGIAYRRLRRHVRQSYRLGAFRVGRRDRVTLRPEGFTEVNDYREDKGGVEVIERKETRVDWSAVGAMEIAKSHALWAVTAKGFLFVPKRAFTHEQAFLDFVQSAHDMRRAFVLEARATPPAAPALPEESLRLPR